MASPTWLGRLSSLAQRVLERMEAMISKTDDQAQPVAYNRVAGFVLTGKEDGAHHVISEMAGALIDIGITVPGQGWTYWNRGPGPSKSYLENPEGHDGRRRPRAWPPPIWLGLPAPCRPGRSRRPEPWRLKNFQRNHGLACRREKREADGSSGRGADGVEQLLPGHGAPPGDSELPGALVEDRLGRAGQVRPPASRRRGLSGSGVLPLPVVR